MQFATIEAAPWKAGLTKLLLMTKLTALMILLGCLQAHSKGLAQRVTLKEKDAPLEKVLLDIHRQAGIQFFYKDEVLDKAGRITIDVESVTVEEALEACFKGLPIAFSMSGKTIVLTAKATVPMLIAAPTPVEIRGRVTDSAGNPLVGASVVVKGGKKGTQTDKNGDFVLEGDGQGSLVVSYSGYETREVKLSSQSSETIRLSISRSPLDEVEVIAYGATTARMNTGNVSSLSAAQIERQPVDNVLLAMEGNVPGIFITQSTGNSGSGVKALIQGQSSIQNGNDPFYVIDGVPYSSELLPNYGGPLFGTSSPNATLVNAGSSGSPLNYINPSDIESITVLKDADATAIYGSRAANGAILITTKRGHAGSTKVGFNIYNGWGAITRTLKMLNTPEFLEMRHEAIANDGLTTQPTDFDINGAWDTTRNTNWQKALLGGTAHYEQATTSVSGGNTLTQYFMSGMYHRETSVFPGNFADRKGAFHVNLNTATANQRFKVSFTGNFMVDDNQLPGNDLTTASLRLVPDAPAPLNPDGSINWAEVNGGSSWGAVGNPLVYTIQPFTNVTDNLVGNLRLSYQVLPGLDLSTSFGYTDLEVNETAFTPLISIAPELRALSERWADYTINKQSSWIVEPQAQYKHRWGGSRVEVLVGSTFQEKDNNGRLMYGYGFSSDALLGDMASAAQIGVSSTNQAVYKYSALFGRVNYIFKDRYILNLNGRRDASSRFGSNNQAHDFESASAGWIFSKEDAVLQTLRCLSFGKLTFSIGTTGNDQIGDYNFLSLYYSNPVGVPYQGGTGIGPASLTNPNLEWEQTTKINVGLELGFLRDRILVKGDFFRNRSSNQLLVSPLPSITGFRSITQNLPATVQNSGGEFTLNTVNVRAAHFTWSSSLNLTVPRNKLLSFANLANSAYASGFILGKPITIQKVVHFAGVNDTTGIYQYTDAKGNLTSNPTFGTDQTRIVNTSPKYYGGLTNSFDYKSWSLDVTLQYIRQIGQNYRFGYNPGVEGYNQPATVLGRWQKPGDEKTIQRYNSDWSLFFPSYYFAAYLSDAAYTDASYLRVRNVALSYAFTGRGLKKTPFQSLRIYVQGENLFTLTRYQGMDPENQSFSQIPPLRVITVGIQCEL